MPLLEVPRRHDAPVLREASLLRRKEAHRLQVECERSFELVHVLELLDGIRVSPAPTWAHPEQKPTPEQVVRIFLGSSAELGEDRTRFELHFRRYNDQLRKRGLRLEIICWENVLDALAENRSQDDYNRSVAASDVFVSLFFTRAGKFTREEFDTAYRGFSSSGKPRPLRPARSAVCRARGVPVVMSATAARRASTGLEGTGRRPRSGRRTRGGISSEHRCAASVFGGACRLVQLSRDEGGHAATIRRPCVVPEAGREIVPDWALGVASA